jgi:hypothetical protein
MMLGNIIELVEAFALSSSVRYEDERPDIVEEEDVARWRYRQFFAWVAANHVAVMKGSIVSPWYLFQRSILEFASSLCAYKTACPKKQHEYPYTPEMLREKTTDYFKSQWPMLVPRFRQLLQSPTGLFTWTGPRFKIWRRDKLPPHFLVLEEKELPESPVFSQSKGVFTQPDVESIVADPKAGGVAPRREESGGDGADAVMQQAEDQADADGDGGSSMDLDSNMDIDEDQGEATTRAAETGESTSGAVGEVDVDEQVEGHAGKSDSVVVSKVFRGKTRSRAESSGL